MSDSDPLRAPFEHPERHRTGDGDAPGGRTNGRQPELRQRPPGLPAPDDDGPGDDPAPWKRDRPPFYLQPRVLLVALVLILGIGVVIFAHQKHGWPPPAECTRNAITTTVGHARVGYPVYWAATGPNGRYAVTVGASAVALSAGTLTVTGAEPRAGDKARVVQQPTARSGCRLIGHFAMPLGLGEYTVRLFRIDGGTATQVASHRVDSDGG